MNTSQDSALDSSHVFSHVSSTYHSSLVSHMPHHISHCISLPTFFPCFWSELTSQKPHNHLHQVWVQYHHSVMAHWKNPCPCPNHYSTSLTTCTCPFPQLTTVSILHLHLIHHPVHYLQTHCLCHPLHCLCWLVWKTFQSRLYWPPWHWNSGTKYVHLYAWLVKSTDNWLDNAHICTTNADVPICAEHVSVCSTHILYLTFIFTG